MSLQFEVTARDGEARVAQLHLNHAQIETPVFMPVGTYATVKAMTPEELEGLGSRLIVANDVSGTLSASWPMMPLRSSGSNTCAASAIVIDACPLRTSVFLGVLAHGAELNEGENLALEAHPLLPIEDRPVSGYC